MARTLISFLGTGDYEQALYHWDGRGEHQTIYVAAALAKLWEADRVIVPATKDAELKHRKSLEASLRAAGCPAPTFRRLPDGRTEQELWEQFEVIRKALEESSSGEILLDITHGYRAQPFFAGAILSVLRATRIEHDRIELVYGEYRKNEVSPIWDLTLFITLVDWAQALGLFVRTGVADAVVELGLNARNRLAREVASSGGSDFPRFERLVNAIENFADDLATMRVASLISGYFQDDSNKSAARGSAARLLDAIEKFQEEVSQKLPPLALVLGELAERLRPLRADRLYSKEGQRAQYALARYYLALGRYPEAAAVIREARINLHAEDERGVEVNSPEYDQGQREAAEFCFNLSDDHRLEIAEVRNDIEHGGFRKQPLAADVLQDRVRKLVERFAVDDVETFLPMEEKAPVSGRTFLITRHPGALEWAERQGLKANRKLEHLDLTDVQAGDVVLGTLPVHLAAAVCEKGARYLHLTMDVPPEGRGRELTADDMERFGARLVEHQVARTGRSGPSGGCENP